MNKTLLVPVKTLKEARKISELFDGSYFSVTSKNGKLRLGAGISHNSLISRSPSDYGNQKTLVGYVILEQLGIKYIVEVPEVEQLDNSIKVGDSVYMTLYGKFRPSEGNPIGVEGVVVGNGRTLSSVSWQGRGNAGYRINRDIIVIPE